MIATAHLTGLGTDIAVSVTEPAALDSAVRELTRYSRTVAATVDRDDAAAEIHAVDVAAGTPVMVSAVLEQIVLRALHFADLTGGATRAVRRSSIPHSPSRPRLGDRRGHSAPTVVGVDSVVPVWHRPRVGSGIIDVPVDVRLEVLTTGRAFLADHAAHRIADRLECGVMVSVGSVAATAGHPPLGGWLWSASPDSEIPDGWACAVVTAHDLMSLPRNPFEPHPHTDLASVRVIAGDANTAQAAAILTHVDADRAHAWADAEDMQVTVISAHTTHAAA